MNEPMAFSLPVVVMFRAINMVEYKKGAKSKEGLTAFKMLASASWRSKSKAFPLGLLSCSGLSAVVCYVGEGISTLYPSFSDNVNDPSVQSWRHSVFSNPPGLDSTGNTVCPDGSSDREGILHVFSVHQSDLLSKHDTQHDMLNWARPVRRHWLCRSVCGDRKERHAKEEAKEASQFGDDEEEIALGGSFSDVVCELEGKALSGSVAFRIVRCPGSVICAVLLRPALGQTSQGILSSFSTGCVTIAVIEAAPNRQPTGFEILEGRDIAFLPPEKPGAAVKALVLSRDGGSITIFEKKESGWEGGTSYRPILGVENDHNYVEAMRLFLVTGDAKCGLAVVGKKHADDKSCILLGPLVTNDQIACEDWSRILPEMSPSHPCLWLRREEEVVSLVCLPLSNSSPQKLAVSTSSRVLIMNCKLGVLARSKVCVASGALAPLGSSSVAFVSRDGKIRYLSCLDRDMASGCLVTIPLPQYGYAFYQLLAVRSDRILYFEWHNGSSLVEQNDDPDCFLLPTAVTKPAMLLEPLVANAICEGAYNVDSTAQLRGVIEKFGRKMASISHGDQEGIGNMGVGITPRVYELLSRYGHEADSSWLLTGRVQFDRSTNSKLLPPWMPVSAKKEGAVNSDAFLHLIANGDQYLSEYIQSPDQNMPSALPRPGDPTSYLCREFGQDSLSEGHAGNALKMLDLAGTDSTESMLLLLSLLLEVKNADSTALLRSLGGYDESSMSSGLPTATSSLAALAGNMRTKTTQKPMDNHHVKRWMNPLAPSLQRGTHYRRARQRLVGEKVLESACCAQDEILVDPQWLSPCNESRHIWYDPLFAVFCISLNPAI